MSEDDDGRRAGGSVRPALLAPHRCLLPAGTEGLTMGTTTDCFLTVATLAIEHNPQTLAAVKEITAREWGEPGLDLDRPWRVGGTVTDALHLSIGHPGGGEPEDVRWEYTILLNLIYHVSDKELGEWCIERFNPDQAKEQA